MATNGMVGEIEEPTPEMRRAHEEAFDRAVEALEMELKQTTNDAACSLVAGNAHWFACIYNALICLRYRSSSPAAMRYMSFASFASNSMDSSHAAMRYMSFAARTRTGGDEMVPARAMRDIVTRCIRR